MLEPTDGSGRVGLSATQQGVENQYQKPRQTWWTLVFNGPSKESSGHYLFSNFFETVEHLAACPAVLNQVAEDGNDWEADPIFLRKIALDYPLSPSDWFAPLTAMRITRKIYSYYDEYVQPEEANLIRQLDKMIRRRAFA